MVDPFAAGLLYLLLFLIVTAPFGLLFGLIRRHGKWVPADIAGSVIGSVAFPVAYLLFGSVVLGPLFPALFNDSTGRDFWPWLWQWSLLLSPLAGMVAGVVASSLLRRAVLRRRIA